MICSDKYLLPALWRLVGKYLIFGERVMVSTLIPEIEHELLRAGKIKWKYFAVHVAQQDLPHVLIWCSQFFQDFEWTQTLYIKLLESKLFIDSLPESNVKNTLELAAQNNRLDLFDHYPDSVLLEHARPWDVLSFSLRWKRWSLATLAIEKIRSAAEDKEPESDDDKEPESDDDEQEITIEKQEFDQQNIDNWIESTQEGQFFHQFCLACLLRLKKELYILLLHNMEGECCKFYLRHLQYFENLSPVYVALSTIPGSLSKTRILDVILSFLVHQDKLEWILQLQQDYDSLWKYSCVKTVFETAQSKGNQRIMNWAYEQRYRSMDPETVSNPVALQWMLNHQVDVMRHYKTIFENALAHGDDDTLKALNRYSLTAHDHSWIKEVTIQKVIRQGKVHIVRWLLDKKILSIDQWYAFPNMLDFICQSSNDSIGFLEVLHEFNLLHVERAYQEAVLNANFYVLNWLYARFGRWTQQHMSYHHTAGRKFLFPLNKIKNKKQMAIAHILKKDNLFELALYIKPKTKMIKMLNWLRNHAASQPFVEYSDGTINNGYHQFSGMAVMMGNIPALKWALSLQDIIVKNQIYCEIAVRAGDLQTLVWLLGNKFPIDVEFCQSICQQDDARHLKRYKTIEMVLKSLDPTQLEKLHARDYGWEVDKSRHAAMIVKLNRNFFWELDSFLTFTSFKLAL
jgi:hypothetical protein